MATTLTFPITYGADDCYATSAGFNNSGTTFRTGGVTFVGAHHGGLRFKLLDAGGNGIPAGATVSAATLTLVRSAVTGSPDLLVYGDTAIDAGAFSASDKPQNVTKTTANLNITSTSADANDFDVADIISELITLPAYTPGAHIRIVILNNGTAGNYADWASYEHATLAAPSLEVVFTSAATISLPQSNAVRHLSTFRRSR